MVILLDICALFNSLYCVLTLTLSRIPMLPPNIAATMEIITRTPRMVRSLFLVLVFLLILRHNVSWDPLGAPPMDSGCRGSKD